LRKRSVGAGYGDEKEIRGGVEFLKKAIGQILLQDAPLKKTRGAAV